MSEEIRIFFLIHTSFERFCPLFSEKKTIVDNENAFEWNEIELIHSMYFLSISSCRNKYHWNSIMRAEINVLTLI